MNHPAKPPHWLKTRRNSLFAATLLAGTAAIGLAVGTGPYAQAQDVQPKPGAIQPQMPEQKLPDFVGLVHEVKPAVVSITAKMKDNEQEQPFGGQGFGNGQQMPFPFPFPFMQQMPQHQRAVEARGSGFIIDPEGTIVTNNHVVKGASSVTVTLDDGTVLPARVIGRDPRSDLAVLRVKAGHPLPFINLGDSSTVEPGQWVIAVGNPFGLGGTVTAGIVSARGRDIGEGPYDSFIQIDAPINPGNSGGPLFTQDGKVVGVNSAIISPGGGGSVGIGFAIPSNTVKSVVAQLEKSGHVTRGYIGVEAQAVSAAMANALHLPHAEGDERGALIASVETDTPAAHAGLQAGDVITAVEGHKIGSNRELAITVSEIPPGTKVPVEIVRNGKMQSLEVTVGTLPSDTSGHGAQSAGSLGLGVALSPITPQLRQQLDLSDGQRGAVITEVKPGSPADQAGLQAGDVITGVGEHEVFGPADAKRAIGEGMKGDQAVALRILRNGEPAFVAVTPSGGDNGDSDDGNG
jgi:serine protease Do